MADTPKSTPVAPWFSAGRMGIASAATVMLINHRSAIRETVAEMSLPLKRNASCIRTHPRWGMRMRRPSRENWSLVRGKRSSTPFLRNFGYFARRSQLDDRHLWRVLAAFQHPRELFALDGVQLAAQGLLRRFG